MQKLGQHFLKNKKYLKIIAQSLEIKKNDLILEIGPGHGELTLEILKSAHQSTEIIAIEKDKKLFGFLNKKFKSLKNLKIVLGDALKIINNLNFLKNKNFKITGNIPYYITGKLLRLISELDKKPEICVFTLQKEVGERICALPGNMNKIAAITQAWANPKIIQNISKKDFIPPPQVDSVIIVLKKIDNPFISQKYSKMVKILFKQPRKTILNNLLTEFKNKELILKTLSELNVSPNLRPQNFSIEQILNFSFKFNKYLL